MADKFIDLQRKFRVIKEVEGDAIVRDLHYALGQDNTLSWDDLQKKFRVILLSEAGTGKTVEIREAARRLHDAGKPSFFLRLENIVDHFELAFEQTAGDHEDWVNWLATNDEGWIFLDSVDESRLRDPQKFELAIRKIGSDIKTKYQHVHIIISSRSPAWRPQSDLALCRSNIPYHPTERVKPETDATVEASTNSEQRVQSEDAPAENDFHFVELEDLTSEQVKIFASEKGITEPDTFLADINRADERLLTKRPQDLEELIRFWKDEGRIGNRLELTKKSIKNRLQERDQNRDEVRSLDNDRAYVGAQLLAATATLSKQSEICVPDGANNGSGLLAGQVLSDWDPQDIVTLLGRPLFDEGLYGHVRFHHRSQREYLTARWFEKLLQAQTSRREIEQMFFQRQYGHYVIVPSLRPILAWLILFDSQMLSKALTLAPEMVFECGEPSLLPLGTRQQALQEFCEAIAHDETKDTRMGWSAIQRLATPDMAQDINQLFTKHRNSRDVLILLLKMVWQGRLGDCLPVANHIARQRTANEYVRITAIRAALAAGEATDTQNLRQHLLREGKELDRDWLSALLEDLPPSQSSIDWLLKALKKTKSPDQRELLGPELALTEYITKLPNALLPLLLKGLAALLRKKPVHQRRAFEVSKRYSWLIDAAAQITERMIKNRGPACLTEDCLQVLSILPEASHFIISFSSGRETDIPALVPEWTELNDAHFWYGIRLARRYRNKTQNEKVTSYWQANWYGQYWSFTTGDFDRASAWITDRLHRDDRLVALSLAFSLYTQAGRPRAWLQQLKQLCNGKPSLNKALNAYLNPPAMTAEEERRQQEMARSRLRHEEEERENERRHADWRDAIMKDPDKLRDPGFDDPEDISEGQWYLYERLNQTDNFRTKYSTGDWELLIGEYGEQVAYAFRDGAVTYWRRHNPPIHSDGRKRKSISIRTIFGQTGLAIEARETGNWAAALNVQDATIAFRYAMNELNGFPDWFNDLYRAHPALITDSIMTEVDYELTHATGSKDSLIIVSSLFWHGPALDSTIAPKLLKKLEEKGLTNIRLLEHAVNIVCRSGNMSNELARVAAQKAQHRLISHAAIWYAAWVGVDAQNAIPALRDRLKKTSDKKRRLNLAMLFITHLAGRHGDHQFSGDDFRTPEHLRDLIIMMHEVIETKDDIDRAGRGVYSPGLRDNAQDARSQLFSTLESIPGKASYLAIRELADKHPNDKSRLWMLSYAKSKAEKEADLNVWQPDQVRSFNDSQQLTPINHRQLADLACLRLQDLKDGLEGGDSSNANILQNVDQETEVRNYIGDWLRNSANGRYQIPQEEELADAKRIDLRFHGIGFDGPVPIELKLADNWSGPDHFERLKNQLCGDYLRDQRSSRGIFLTVYRGEKTNWDLPDDGGRVDFNGLVEALQAYWLEISHEFPDIEDIKVIGIDLTARLRSASKSG